MKKTVWTWIMIQDWRVLLIKRSKNKQSSPDIWTFPWWRWEEYETPEETVIREVKEEVWLTFKIEKLYKQDENERTKYYDFLWKWNWKISLQMEECDWYGWFFSKETEYLPMNERIKHSIKKLFDENLIS